MDIKEGVFKVLIKANASKNEILGYDEEKKAYRVAVKAKAQEGAANKKLIKFLSKTLGKKVRIKSGFRSKEKLLEVSQP